MVGEGFLAGEHRRVVDRFIEGAADVLAEGLSIAERNQHEINLRFQVETQLVPGLLAVNALLLGSSPGALEKDLPEWIERVSTLLPEEAAFLTEVGKTVDSSSYGLLAENLGLSPDQCLAVEVFQAHLLGMAPFLAKVRLSQNHETPGCDPSEATPKGNPSLMEPPGLKFT